MKLQLRHLSSSHHFFSASLFALFVLFSRHVPAAGLIEVEEMQKRPAFHTAEKTKRFQKTAPFVSERPSFVEGERVELRGTLEIWYEEHLDDEGGFSTEKMRKSFWIRTEDGYAYELLDAETLHQLEPGSIVRIVGIMRQGKIAVESTQNQNIDNSAPETDETFSTSVSGLQASEERARVGARRTAVIVFGFREDTGAPVPFSDDFIREKVFTDTDSANALLQEMSFGQLELVGYHRRDGDIYGGYAIHRPRPVGCKVEGGWDEVVHEVQTAAYRDGFRMSRYEHVILLMPYFKDCEWAGRAAVRGTWSSLNGTLSTYVTTHELGHNLGLEHANSLWCHDRGRRTVLGPDCEEREYGDIYDTMGKSLYHFSAFYKARLGWMTPQNYTDIRRSGTFFIAPLEMSSNETQLLRIPLPDGEYYYLDLRKNHGFDTFPDEDCFAFPCDIGTKGIMIRKGKGYAQYQHSQLLDLTPETDTFFDSVLLPGQSFQDAAHGIEIRTLNVLGVGATVEITLGTTPPERHELHIFRLGRGRVIARPGNIDCGDNCFASFSQPTAVLLEAIPERRTTFIGWDGPYCSGRGSCTLSVEGRKAVTAQFRRDNIFVSILGTGADHIVSRTPGIACGLGSEDCSHSLDEGESIELEAVAAPDSSFVQWLGACWGAGTGSCRLLGNRTFRAAIAEQHAIAEFAKNNLVIRRAGSSGGRIVSTDGRVDCRADRCSYYIPPIRQETRTGSPFEPATIELEAVPLLNTHFIRWEGGACDGSTARRCVIEFDFFGFYEARAVFEEIAPTLSVSKQGSGTVHSNDYGIWCGQHCSVDCPYGTVTELTAQADRGSHFIGWAPGGACGGSTSPACRVEMNGDQHAIALFGHRGLTILLHALTLSKVGSGSGRIVSAPTGIDCGSTCQHQFTENIQVTLNATAALGSSFRGWRGPCSGNGSCTVMMNQAHTVTAHFHAGPTVTVIAEGTGRGNIASTVGSGNFQIRYGVDCNTTCSASFRAGDQVNLTATPQPGHRFLGWSGGTCHGTGICSFTMGAPLTIRARFEE